MQNNRIEISAKLIQIDSGNDFFDRYLRPKSVYTYTFESERKRYVWQINEEDENLIEGSNYQIVGIEGRKLFGGRGISLMVIGISSYS